MNTWCDLQAVMRSFATSTCLIHLGSMQRISFWGNGEHSSASIPHHLPADQFLVLKTLRLLKVECLIFCDFFKLTGDIEMSQPMDSNFVTICPCSELLEKVIALESRVDIGVNLFQVVRLICAPSEGVRNCLHAPWQ